MAVPLVLEAERINPWTFSTSYGEENRENKVGFSNYQKAKYQSGWVWYVQLIESQVHILLPCTRLA